MYFFTRNLNFGILLGNSLAKYDQALFSLLIPILATSLFSDKESLTALMLVYSLTMVEWIARPIGGLFFGWIADEQGHKKALCYSLAGIAFSALLMGSFPLFSGSSLLSPIIISVIRLFKSFFAAGESANGAIFMLEQSAVTKRNWMSSLYDASSTLGWLIASILVACLVRWGNIHDQWPWLFWLGSLIAIYGLILRMNMPNPFIKKQQLTHTSTKEIFKKYKGLLLSVIAVSGFSATTYTFAFTLMHGYMPIVSHLSYQSLIEINILLVFLDILLLPLLAYTATYWGHRSQMLWTSILMILSVLPMFYLMQKVSLSKLLLCRVWIMILGVGFSSTYHAWVQTVIPTIARCRIASLGYALGSRLIGMPAAIISVWLFQKTGLIGAPIFYLGFTALIAAIAIYNTKPANS